LCYLIEAFLQRVNSPERSLRQIVLDEAIIALPKLTNEQINTLSLVISFIHLNHNVLDLDSFSRFLQHEILDFYNHVDKDTFYTHLQYTGCCVLLSEGAKYKPLVEIFKSRYTAFFSKGFSEDDLTLTFGGDKNRMRLIKTTHWKLKEKILCQILKSLN
jgi:hypothetical protein